MNQGSDSGADSPTADDDVNYVYESVKAVRGREATTKAERQNRGWELVSETRGMLRTEMTFRRVKPKTVGTYLSAFASRRWATFRRLEPAKQRNLLAGSGGALLLVIVLNVAIGGSSGNGDPKPTTAPTKAAVKASEKPSGAPSEEPPSEPSADPIRPVEKPAKEVESSEPPGAKVVTDAEVVSAFQDYLDERAAEDVLVAKAVTDVSFGGRVLRVTFDPSEVGMDQDTFDANNAFNNPYDPDESLADFVSTPISFNTELGLRLRSGMDRIETVYADGTPDGARTIAEIIEMNEL